MTIDRLSKRVQERWSEESGQSAVLVAMLCGVLIFVIAMTTNIGKLVTEKIAMQNAIDLAVYSGAAVQAGKMNEMRGHNDDIWKSINRTRQTLQVSDPGPNPVFVDPTKVGPACAAAALIPKGLSSPFGEATIAAARAEILAYAALLQGKNLSANASAFSAARDAANLNYQGTGNLLRPYHNMGPLMNLKRVKIDLTYRAMCFVTPIILIPAVYANGATIDGWFFKDDKGEVAFVAGILDAHPNSPYMDSSQRYFGSTSCTARNSSPRNGRCGLSTFAAATPFYGKLGASHGLVFGESQQLNYNNVDFIDGSPFLSVMIDRNSLIGNFQPKSNKYRDYRVRFVGLDDRDANFVRAGGGNPIINNSGTGSYRNQIKH